jgi:hypothetical protein
MGAEERPAGRWVIGLVKSMRWVLWVLLIASVLVTLEGMPALREAVGAGKLPSWLTLAPALMLGAFIVGYAVYRFTLVQSDRYPAGKAMVQIALMSLFLALVVRGSGERELGAKADAPVDLARALASSEPELRALAAEALRARSRPEAQAHAERLIAMLSDPSAEVRRQAHASLVFVAGKDLGEGAGAAERWRAAVAAPGP